MKIIAEIANNICDNIQVTYDIPSNYEDKKVPIFYLKAGINSSGQIEYEFYKKPITSNLLKMRSSAMQMKQKLQS